jgi:heme-degrading monooxygenase HmoA
VTFEVFPDKSDDFEKLFIQEYRPAMASMPGYIKVELLREQNNPSHYQMVIRFTSEETAAAWRSSSAHQALSPKLKTLYNASQLQVYDFVI